MLDVIETRRQLHKIPEIGFDLPETVQYVKNALSGLSCKVFEPCQSAVCAFFDMGGQDAIAFRADMDALQVSEKTGASFSSAHEGKMHACGHDGHVAMLLALAHEIDAMGEKPLHNILLVFQPAEESGGGAQFVCESGVFEEYAVKCIFAIHLWPFLPLGGVFSRPGAMMACACEVDITMEGRSAHVAKASEGADALEALAKTLLGCYEMEKNEIASEVPRLLKFGLLNAGTVRNAIAANGILQGTLRAFDDDTFGFLKRRVQEIAQNAADETGCTLSANFTSGYPALINDEKLFARVLEVLGEENVGILDEPSITAEDFSFYGQKIPSVFLFVGTGLNIALHADNYNINENALFSGLDVLKKLLEV